MAGKSAADKAADAQVKAAQAQQEAEQANVAALEESAELAMSTSSDHQFATDEENPNPNPLNLNPPPGPSRIQYPGTPKEIKSEG